MLILSQEEEVDLTVHKVHSDRMPGWSQYQSIGVKSAMTSKHNICMDIYSKLTQHLNIAEPSIGSTLNTLY